MKRSVILIIILSVSFFSYAQYEREIRVGVDLKSDYFLSLMNASYGIKKSPNLFLGLGASYNLSILNFEEDGKIIGSSRILPINAEAEYRIFEGWISPFVFLKAGVENVFFREHNETNSKESTRKYKLLGTTSPGIGLSIKPAKNLGLRIAYSGIFRTSAAWDIAQTGNAIFLGCEFLF